MRKFIVPFLAGLMVLATCSITHAQDVFSLGLRAGINAANFGGEGVSNANNSTLMGANFGALANYSTSRTFALSGEINFSMKGAKFSNSSTALNYLEIPVYGNLFFGKSDKFRPKIFAGPYLGLLMTAQTSAGGTKTDVKNFYNNTDFGGIFGAGAHFKISGENWLIVDARYGLGLADVTTASSAVYNRGFSVNLAVTFPLSKIQ